MRLTRKQREIMALVLKGKIDEDVTVAWLDIDQLLDALPYRTTKASIHFSIRALADKNLLEKGETELRRGRVRRTLVPTNLAFDLLTAAPSEPSEGDEDLDAIAGADWITF